MQTYTLTEHFLELKARLIRILVIFGLGVGVCYYFSHEIGELLLEPLHRLRPDHLRKIIYTGLSEAFFIYLKLAVFSSCVIIMPILVIEIYLFISPGLRRSERKLAAFMLATSPTLFWLGGIFVFYYVMPRAWYFFLSFEQTNITMPLILEARISEYLNLVMQLIIAFGLAFQLPIILLMLNLVKLVTITDLKRHRRLAVVVNFIIAGILAPPDVISQFALAIPMIGLYEAAIIAGKFVENRGQ